MKIQEMKSGILHLGKKVGDERQNNLFEIRPAVEAAIEVDLPILNKCELEEPRWAVVSFDQVEAGGMTYDQAAVLMTELNTHRVSGLCIITDNAASQLKS